MTLLPTARRRVAGALLVLALTGCAPAATRPSSPTATSTPLACSRLFPDVTCGVVDLGAFTVVHIGRFVVGLDPRLIRAAAAPGVSLVGIVSSELARVEALLPGPPAAVVVEQTTDVTPQTGELGYTDPRTGQVLIQLDPHSQAPFSQTLTVWLAEALAHEVDHSVRVLAGPGFGTTLGEYLVSEGVASAFFHEAFPGTDAPWEKALTAQQELGLWGRAEPLLAEGGVALYRQWFYGGGGVPEWAGFTIGYHIAQYYLSNHPGTTAAFLVDIPASTVLQGSGYAG